MGKLGKVLSVLAAFAPVVLATSVPPLTSRIAKLEVYQIPLTMLLLLFSFMSFVALIWIVSNEGDHSETGRR